MFVTKYYNFRKMGDNDSPVFQLSGDMVLPLEEGNNDIVIVNESRAFDKENVFRQHEAVKNCIIVYH